MYEELRFSSITTILNTYSTFRLLSAAFFVGNSGKASSVSTRQLSWQEYIYNIYTHTHTHIYIYIYIYIYISTSEPDVFSCTFRDETFGSLFDLRLVFSFDHLYGLDLLQN